MPGWFLLAACTTNPPALDPNAASTLAQQAEIAAYGFEEQECVARAATRGDADVCIMAVKSRWCGDGGALAARGDCPAQVRAAQTPVDAGGDR